MQSDKFVKIIQGWVGVVGLMALGNTIQCYIGHELLADRLYTRTPHEVNGLMARLFATWTLLAAILRLYCAFNIENRGVYNLTVLSFFLALVHFVSETFYFKSCQLTIGVITPLIISSFSFVLMLVGYNFVGRRPEYQDETPHKRSRTKKVE